MLTGRLPIGKVGGGEIGIMEGWNSEMVELE
jgi:hypothetical protein